MLDENWPLPSGFSGTVENKGVCGVDPRQDPEVLAIYRTLRDARSNARAQERSAEADPSDIAGLPARDDWQTVERHCFDILSTHSKDVEVVVWLIEAATRLYGYEGLARSAALLADMVEAHGTALHPQPEDKFDDTFASVSGLNGVGRPGTLLQPLRLVPLVPGETYGAHGLWHIENAGHEVEVQLAMKEAGTEAMTEQMRHVTAARTALERADTALTAIRGTDAPPFGQVVELLDDAERMIRRLGGLESIAAPDVETSAQSNVEPVAVNKAGGPIRSREMAFDKILEVAAYFRKTEPHSPIADSLETLVRRGRMDFISLIAELIPDDMARQSVLTTAGIQKIESPTGDEDG